MQALALLFFFSSICVAFGTCKMCTSALLIGSLKRSELSGVCSFNLSACVHCFHALMLLMIQLDFKSLKCMMSWFLIFFYFQLFLLYIITHGEFHSAVVCCNSSRAGNLRQHKQWSARGSPAQEAAESAGILQAEWSTKRGSCSWKMIKQLFTFILTFQNKTF